MYKHCKFIILFAIVLLLTTACKTVQETAQPPSPDTQTAEERSSTEKPISDTSEEKQSQDPEYFFVDSLFMGAYEDGKFLSRANHEFTYGEFLTQPWFELYSQSEHLGRSTEAKIAESGLEHPFSEEDAKLLGQFSLREEDCENIYQLPVMLSDEAFQIPYTDYNGHIQFGDGILATNAKHNPLPRSVEKSEITERDLKLVQKELDDSGISGAKPNVDEVYLCDLNGDGNRERIIVSNALRDKNRQLIVTENELKNGNSGNYTIVLVDHGTDVECIFKDVRRYKKTERLENSGKFWVDYFTHVSEVAGIFDFNGDGIFEICMHMEQLWGGTYKVYSSNSSGKYEQILESDYGS